MRYEKYAESPYRGMYINIASWCNMVRVIKTFTFREFCIKNGIGLSRYRYMVDFEKQRNSPYTYKKIPYVCRKGLFLTVSKKTLQKCFPDKKDIIEKYIQENDPNLSNVEDVRKMFKTILK